MVLGAVVGFLGSEALGFCWFNPNVFGTKWMDGAFPGKTPQEIDKTSSKLALPSLFLSHAALAAVVDHTINRLGITSYEGGVKTALCMATIMVLGDVCHNAFSQKPASYFLINHSYDTAVLLIMATSIIYFK